MSMLGGWLHDYLLQRQFFLYFSSLKRFFSMNLHNQLFVYDSFRKELLVFFIWQKKKNELWSQKGIPFLKGCLLPNPRKNLWKKFEEKSKIRYLLFIIVSLAAFLNWLFEFSTYSFFNCKNMATFEVFRLVISSSINHFFLKSDNTYDARIPKYFRSLLRRVVVRKKSIWIVWKGECNP